MEFTLHYRGDLKAKGSPKDKQRLRRHFHAQLAILWQQLPLNAEQGLLKKEPAGGGVSIIHVVNGFDYAPLVNERLNLIAELKITLLRPEPPGSIITQAGDIDNRLKTLFDALTVPKEASAMPADDKPQEGETPFFCLLEDDNLITKVSVETDRLLYSHVSSSEVEMLIHVTTKATIRSWHNIGIS